MSESVEQRLAQSGYTPAVRDLPRVLALLGHRDDAIARGAERALARAGDPALELVRSAFPAASRPLRGRLCALVGKIAHKRGEAADGPLARFLVGCLSDDDAETRRRAISALGRLGDPSFEPALVHAWDLATLPEDRRALARALGNVGGALAIGRLGARPTGDPELERLAAEAVHKANRKRLRSAPSSIDASRACEGGVDVLLHVRAGLEELLLDELGSASSARIAGRGRVQVRTSEPLARLFRARTFLHLGFPLPAEPAGGDDATNALVRALTSAAAQRIFEAFTEGPVRYRIEWADAGRRRAATFDVAARVLELRPELHNDPSSAPWEAVVSERGEGDARRLFVELWPRGLVDPRFAYRVKTLPAASHPTVAAALARVGGARPDDVVWDPFVGSGAELVERALLGPCAVLHGTDVSDEALAAARANLTAAGAIGWSLEKGDARQLQTPEGLSLVITNPPFGRRVLSKGDVTPLLGAILEKVASALRPGGRLVWISPAGDTTAELARRHGLAVRLRRAVDMGGIPGELQLFVLSEQRGKPARERRSRPARRRPAA